MQNSLPKKELRNLTQHQEPAYAVGSLDRGLRILQLLRDDGSLRVVDVADRLGIARSSAHRLLAALVYRGFALQNEDHNYLPGPSLGAGPAPLGQARRLRGISEPHLEVLSRRVGESTNLMIRVGKTVRFLRTIEATRGTLDCEGAVMQARKASGGKALLATMTDAQLEDLYEMPSGDGGEPPLPQAEFERLLTELKTVRQREFAVNLEETERSVTAIGVALQDSSQNAIGAISVSFRPSHLRRHTEGLLIQLIKEAQREIERDIADTGLKATTEQPSRSDS